MTDNHNLSPDERARQRRGRILGASVMLVVLLPMLAAYLIFYTGMGMPRGTVNQGDLLSPPLSIEAWQLGDMVGETWATEEQPVKWRLLIPGDGQCDTDCRANLYVTRQVHVRLGEKALRVERYYLLEDETLGDSLADFLEEEHPTLKVLRVNGDAMRATLARTNLPGDPIADGRYFLMDQQGFVMMGYLPEHTGNDLLKDLKRMLRYSYEE